MPHCPSVVCPVDFSEASRGALCYAAAIADHFGARLTIVGVDDPLLSEVAAATGRVPSLAEESEYELHRFCGETLARVGHGARTVDYRVASGKPATEILRVAREAGAELIVMGSHGRSGVRKMFFGSTTERVLRETFIPVLVTPDDRERVVSLSAIAAHVHRIVAPVDLTEHSPHQVTVAAGVAAALSVPLILVHVIEPAFIPYSVRLLMPGADAERRSAVEEQLSALAESAAHGAVTESVVLTGEPSEEIVKLADVRDAHLIVMGLHSSGLLGPRMGSVTYRVLCLAHTLVLSLPPMPATADAVLPASGAVSTRRPDL
jgi:nucleotide-binding universal stress UspA family protein